MKSLQILPILLLITYYQSNAQHVLTLKPYGNMGSTVMIWSNYPDSNMVTWPEVKANAWTWDGYSGIERSLFYFNLSSIPANSTIQSAKLSLYGYEGDADSNYGSNESLIQRITSAWNPATVTWNTQPNSDTVHETILPKSTGYYQDYLNINVTSLIKDLYNNQDTFKGLMIKLDTESLYRRLVFRSAHQSDSTKFPTLTINYFLLGVDEISTEDYFTIFPNPSGNRFIISRSSESGDADLAIYNESGEKVYSTRFSYGQKQKEIYLKDAVTGIYLVRVTIDGVTQYCKKLLIK